MAGLPPELRCACESVRMLLLGRVLAVAQMWSYLSVSPPACLLVLQGDGELGTQAGSDPVPARGKDGCVLLCAITKGFFQSELKIKYALVTGQTFLSHFNNHLAQGAVL